MRFESEFFHEVRAVRFRGPAAYEQSGGNLGAGFTFGGQFEDEQFALGQLRAANPGNQAFESRVDRFLPERFS